VVTRTAIVLNLDSGTLKGLSNKEAEDLVLSHIGDELGHTDVVTVPGADLVKCLETVFPKSQYERIIVCGGDGTISLAARLAFKHAKILGVIPGGTMNLFARTLGIPLDLEQACKSLNDAKIISCDMGSCNGQAYVHQFSIGLQPEVITERKKLTYRSRVSKMWASLRTLLTVALRKADYKVNLELPDRSPHAINVCLLTVSNNPYGPGHLPYADRLDGGKLAMYWSRQLTPWRKTRLISDILTGRWETNSDLKTLRSSTLTLQIDKLPKHAAASIDGELIALENRLIFETLKGALRVLVPQDSPLS